MATMYGGEVHQWLIQRGWRETHRTVEDFRCGDAAIVDPQDGKELNVYVALKMHHDRTGEFPDFLPDDWKTNILSK